jgi:AcrR family transcriptional regulator
VTDDTPSRLVDSALMLLREKGLDAVTLRAVGDLSGVSRTAPYRHFADKTALLAALAARILADLTAHVSEAVLRHDSPDERLRAFYLSYVEYAMAHRQEYRLVFAADFLADDHPELAAAIDRGMEALGLGYRTGDPSVSRAPVMALLASAHGLADLATSGHLAHKQLTPAEVVDALISIGRPAPL